MKKIVFLLMFVFPSICFAQMQHAVIYLPETTIDEPVDIAPKAVTVQKIVPALKECRLKYCWKIKAHKEASIWYAYISEAELKCLSTTKETKYWVGATAREAWKAAYNSGVEEAKEVVEQTVKVPVTVIDAETGKQVEKYYSVADAKALGNTPDMAKELASKKDAGLPMKIFDGSK